jgi:VWFA-related protein
MQHTVRWTVVGLAALIGCSAAAIAAAQREPAAPPPQRLDGKIEVRDVLLDALVADARGNVVVGLAKNDFVVSENGRPVELTGVTFYGNRQRVQGSAALARRGLAVDHVPEDRYFILFFTDQRGSIDMFPVLLHQQFEAGARAKQWVEREVLPNDWVAVTGFDGKLKIYQDFTHDHAALTAAIDDAVKGKDVENDWPSRPPKAGGAPSLLAGLPRGNELRERTAGFYDGIQVLARAAGNVPARKNLVLFIPGFARISPPPYSIYDPHLRPYLLTVQALNDNHVAAYPVDLWPVPLVDLGMNQLATETGGRFVYQFNNFLTVLEQISQENSGYYLLSYRSEHPAGSSGFQPVEVTTTNPELRVKVRTGYDWGSARGPQPSR